MREEDRFEKGKEKEFARAAELPPRNLVFSCEITVAPDSGGSGLEIRGEVCRLFVTLFMNHRSLTPRVHAALRRLAAGPQDMRDEALLQEINDEMKKLPVEDVAYVRDRVRYSCSPCPMVQSVVLMLNGLIEVKNLQL